MKTIVLCSSGSFYKHVNELKAELEKLGFKAVVPTTAAKMAESGEYDISKYKTWYKDHSTMDKKRAFMDAHFDEVKKGDAILVVNDTKNGVEGYIGSNVLMEMTLAYIMKKPIYVLNSVSESLGCWEEVIGMGSILLDGDVGGLSSFFK